MIGYSISVYEFVEGMDITPISNDNEALATWTSGPMKFLSLKGLFN